MVKSINETEKKEFSLLYDTIEELIIDTIKNLNDRISQLNDSTQSINYIPSGISQLSFYKGDLIILGYHKVFDKTTFLIKLLNQIGIIEKRSVGLITTGLLDYLSIGRKLLEIQTNISNSKIQNGIIKADDICKIQKASETISKSPIFFKDIPNGSFYELEGVIRCMVQEEDIEMIFIDSFDFLEEVVNCQKNNNLCSRGELLNSYKQIARKLNTPIIVLMEFENNMECIEPILLNFKKDIDILRNTDMILYLQNKRNYLSNNPVTSELIISKNSHGLLGTIPLEL